MVYHFVQTVCYRFMKINAKNKMLMHIILFIQLKFKY